MIVMSTVVLLAGCAGSEEAATTTAAQTVPPTIAPDKITVFASWYEQALAESGYTPIPELAPQSPNRGAAFELVILQACQANPGGSALNEGAAARLAQEPAWFGDRVLAGSGIVMARIACGLSM